jgi:hypothetical protein
MPFSQQQGRGIDHSRCVMGSVTPNPNVDPVTMLRLPNLLISHPAADMARTEPIAAIINDLPKTAGEK